MEQHSHTCPMAKLIKSHRALRMNQYFPWHQDDMGMTFSKNQLEIYLTKKQGQIMHRPTEYAQKSLAFWESREAANQLPGVASI